MIYEGHGGGGVKEVQVFMLIKNDLSQRRNVQGRSMEGEVKIYTMKRLIQSQVEKIFFGRGLSSYS